MLLEWTQEFLTSVLHHFEIFHSIESNSLQICWHAPCLLWLCNWETGNGGIVLFVSFHNMTVIYFGSGGILTISSGRFAISSGLHTVWRVLNTYCDIHKSFNEKRVAGKIRIKKWHAWIRLIVYETKTGFHRQAVISQYSTLGRGGALRAR